MRSLAAQRKAVISTSKTRLISETLREKERQRGLRLAELNREKSPEERSAIAGRALNSKRAKYSTEQISAFSAKGGYATAKLHPEILNKGRKKAIDFWRTAEGREFASKRADFLWSKESHRATVSSKNKEHALSGRIGQHFHQRPTANERVLVDLANALGLPIEYTGDGRLRIETKGQRNWRNPDFIVSGQKKVILLDTQIHRNQQILEEKDYSAAGWRVLRISTAELLDPEWIDRKIRRFIDG